MATFKDNTGAAWEMIVDAPTVERVRKHPDLMIDLTDTDGATWTRLETDLVLRVNVIWSLCERQARDMIDDVPDDAWQSDDPEAVRPTKRVRGVTAERFGRRLLGCGLANATEALVQAVEDFFPPERRSLLRALMEKNLELTKTGVAKMIEKMNDPTTMQRVAASMDRRMEAELEDSLTQLERPTNSRASAESTHTG